jgi:hypothetical protein
MNAYDQVALLFAGTEPNEGNFKEMAAFFEAQLKKTLPPQVLNRLFEIQAEFRDRQARLVGRLQAQEISRERYLDEFNAALKRSMQQSLETLGERDFMLAYGEAGLHPECLVDKAIFLNATK